MGVWRRIDVEVGPKPYFLESGDECYYAREYISEGGYEASEANQLISNFKKDPSKKGTGQWYYKQRDATRFAQELAAFIPNNCWISIIPTSKPSDHAEYDPRFDMMLETLQDRRPDLSVTAPIFRAIPCQSLHKGGHRNILKAMSTMGWRGFKKDPPHLILIDDVITCGTNFKACQRILQQFCPKLEVYGVFWTRTVWLDGDEPDWEDDA